MEAGEGSTAALALARSPERHGLLLARRRRRRGRHERAQWEGVGHRVPLVGQCPLQRRHLMPHQLDGCPRRRVHTRGGCARYGATVSGGSAGAVLGAAVAGGEGAGLRDVRRV